ncbi:DNA-binding protein [Propionivibrio sp.]|uniref:DNA-binding protein n=1 Tax=Propionivibrio sp. TaxID=2212460 RepID=UPI003BF2EA1F
MAREPKITQTDVDAAAEKIAATGRKPTARAIRDVLGVGSMATVLKHMQIWMGSQPRLAVVPNVLPPGLQKTLADFVAEEVSFAKATIEADLSTAEQTIDDLVAESERLAAVIADQAQELKMLGSEKTALSGRFVEQTSRLENTIQKLEEQRQAAERARTAQATLEVRLEALPQIETEMGRFREALDAERTARIAAEQNAAVASAKLETTEALLNELQARLTRSANDGRHTRRKKLPTPVP